jgi:flagellar basal-body rod modification protein FlgD
LAAPPVSSHERSARSERLTTGFAARIARERQPERAMTISAMSNAASNSSMFSSSGSSTNISSTDFLNLLISELRNQDPLNATSTTDFMNQLSSYASFTEQQSINSSMTSLAGSFSSLVTLNSVNYIGHTVTAITNSATLTDGSATFGYSLSAASSNVTITIKDASGNTVYTGSGTGNEGSNTFTWDGKDSNGTQLSDGGQYTISVTATDAAGNSVFNYATTTGIVTGIDTSTSTPSLTVNGVSVSAANIIAVKS